MTTLSEVLIRKTPRSAPQSQSSLTTCVSAAGDPSVAAPMNLFLWLHARQLQTLG